MNHQRTRIREPRTGTSTLGSHDLDLLQLPVKGWPQLSGEVLQEKQKKKGRKIAFFAAPNIIASRMLYNQ